jgi:hypothetical protein
MDRPKRTAKKSVGSGEAITTVPSRLNRSPSHPHWNTATTTPYAPPIDSRFITAAFSGTVTERNTTISSRNDAARIAEMKIGRVSVSCPVRSSVMAVRPDTATLAGARSRMRWRVSAVSASAGAVVGMVGSTIVSPAGEVRGSPTMAMPGSAAMRSDSAGMACASTPGLRRSATSSSGALKPGPKPSAIRS